MTQRCTKCTASLSYLVGDVTPYELIDPLEGGHQVLVPHNDERCRFHQFLTPELQLEPPMPTRQISREMVAVGPASPPERWVRTDAAS